MLRDEVKSRMKDNTVCRTKLENYRPVIHSPLVLKVFEYMLLGSRKTPPSENSPPEYSLLG